MHDKPTDETRKATPASGSPLGDVADPVPGVAELPGRIAELSAVDPAQAPEVADEIAAVLEASLDAAPGATTAAETRDDDPAPDPR